MSDKKSEGDVQRRLKEDQEKLERLAREASERDKKFQKRRAPPETMPRPGDTSKVGHIPGLG